MMADSEHIDAEKVDYGGESALLKSQREQKCEMCFEKTPKYKCPRCERQTCSLQCVKQHKASYSCDGVRCKTAFVSLQDFGDNHLLSDYRFLEDVSRCADNAVRDPKSRHKRFRNHIFGMKQKARRKGVQLRLMPVGMSKRKENTTYYNFREKCFFWRVKLIFVDADSQPAIIAQRVNENETVCDLLKKYMDPEQADPVTRQKLISYVLEGMENLKIFFRDEIANSNKQNYFPVDPKLTLMQNLKHRIIVEYPTFVVALARSADKYEAHTDATTDVHTNNHFWKGRLDNQHLDSGKNENNSPC